MPFHIYLITMPRPKAGYPDIADHLPVQRQKSGLGLEPLQSLTDGLIELSLVDAVIFMAPATMIIPEI